MNIHRINETAQDFFYTNLIKINDIDLSIPLNRSNPLKRVYLILLCIVSSLFFNHYSIAATKMDNIDQYLPFKIDQTLQVSIEWKINRSVPAGSYIRLLANGIRILHIFTSVELSALLENEKLKLESVRHLTDEDRKKDFMFVANNPFCVLAKTDSYLPSGTIIISSGRLKTPIYPGRDFGFRLEFSENQEGPWTPISNWKALDLKPEEPVKIQAFYRSNGQITVVYVDKYYNPSNPGERTIEILDLNGKKYLDARIENSPSLTISPPADIALPTRLIIRDNKGFEAKCNPRPQKSFDGCNTYFGEIHWHSEFSGDAYRNLQECFDYAREQIALDFATPGDHYPNRIQEYFDIIDRNYNPGSFVTFPGFELSISNGHINFYFRKRGSFDKFEDAWKATRANPDFAKPDALRISPFYEAWNPEEVIMIPHHMNITSGTFEKVIHKDGYALWRQFDWRGADDRFIRLAEIVQTRGSFETEKVDTGWFGKSGGYGSSIRSALARGLRFGFIGGTDNHDGWPVRGTNATPELGLAAVQAKELTREAIFDAMRARRTYATTGARIDLDFCLNGKYPMGSEAKLLPIEKRTFKISIHGTAPLDIVEIISAGTELASIPVNGTEDLETEWTDPRDDAPIDNCYYYLRLRQKDGNCAWSSPIWVDYLEKR